MGSAHETLGDKEPLLPVSDGKWQAPWRNQEPPALMRGCVRVFQLYVTSLLEGMFFVFFNLAETASLRHVVDKEQLATAAAQNEATYNFTFLVSPLLGG